MVRGAMVSEQDTMEQGRPRPLRYCIAVKGSLDRNWLTWLDEVAFEATGDVTVLRVTLADQAALRGLLSQLWDLNIAVLSVKPAGIESKTERRRSYDG